MKKQKGFDTESQPYNNSNDKNQQEKHDLHVSCYKETSVHLSVHTGFTGYTVSQKNYKKREKMQEEYGQKKYKNILKKIKKYLTEDELSGDQKIQQQYVQSDDQLYHKYCRNQANQQQSPYIQTIHSKRQHRRAPISKYQQLAQQKPRKYLMKYTTLDTPTMNKNTNKNTDINSIPSANANIENILKEINQKNSNKRQRQRQRNGNGNREVSHEIQIQGQGKYYSQQCQRQQIMEMDDSQIKDKKQVQKLMMNDKEMSDDIQPRNYIMSKQSES